MKKKWYDYLWIASLTYLVLGFFNILFCLAGPSVLFYSPSHIHCRWNKGLLQPLLRQGPAVFSAGRPVWPVPET